MLHSTATLRLTALPGDRAVDNVAKRKKERGGEEQALLAAVPTGGSEGACQLARRRAAADEHARLCAPSGSLRVAGAQGHRVLEHCAEVWAQADGTLLRL